MTKLYKSETERKLYYVWANLKHRCNSPKFDRYYGRQFSVSAEWENFDTFFADMAPTYQPGLSIERIDNDSGYSKANCTWTTPKLQGANRANIKLTMTDAQAIRERYNAGGIKQNELAALYQVAPRTISDLLAGKTW